MLYHNVYDAAKLLGISPPHVYVLIRRGTLKTIKKSNRLYITSESLESYKPKEGCLIKRTDWGKKINKEQLSNIKWNHLK